MRAGATTPSTCPLSRNLCDSGCAWSLGGKCAVAVLAEAFQASETDADETERLMAAASREHLRPCGTFHELTSEIFD